MALAYEKLLGSFSCYLEVAIHQLHRHGKIIIKQQALQSIVHCTWAR